MLTALIAGDMKDARTYLFQCETFLENARKLELMYKNVRVYIDGKKASVTVNDISEVRKDLTMEELEELCKEES